MIQCVIRSGLDVPFVEPVIERSIRDATSEMMDRYRTRCAKRTETDPHAWGVRIFWFDTDSCGVRPCRLLASDGVHFRELRLDVQFVSLKQPPELTLESRDRQIIGDIDGVYGGKQEAGLPDGFRGDSYKELAEVCQEALRKTYGCDFSFEYQVRDMVRACSPQDGGEDVTVYIRIADPAEMTDDPAAHFIKEVT